MKHSIAYLPKRKQRDLQLLVQSICALLPQTQMIILYGSYATGKYVEYDERIEFGRPTFYLSDYDLLVITHNIQPSLVQGRLDAVENMYTKDSDFQTPLQIFALDIDQVNSDLSEGRYFMTQLKKEGVMLYDSGKFKLARRRKLKYSEIKQQAEEYYNDKYVSAKEFMLLAEVATRSSMYKKASFLLHQVTENLFFTIRLVFTLRNPKQHNLARILGTIKRYAPELASILPRNTVEEKRLFELLKAAYVEARYNPDFVVTKNDIDVLMEKIERLFELVKRICEAQIKSYEESV